MNPTTTAEGWIEEGRVWRGERPPEGHGAPRDWVELPHEHYIPIQRARLVEAVASLPSARRAGEGFAHLVDLVEGLLHHHYRRSESELKDDYEYFAPVAGAALRRGLSEQELDRRERRFLANMLRLMTRGNFRPLREPEHRRALEHNYLFDLPVEVRWEAHDERLLGRFFEYARSPEGAWVARGLGVAGSLEAFLDLPREVGPRALVFYRGLGIDRTEGRFPLQKIDLLLGRIVRAVTAPARWLLGAKEEREEGPAEAPRGERSTHFPRRWVRRVNLEADLGLLSPLRVSRLQEATFGLLVVLFRLRPAGAAPDERAIHVKLFRDVPMADAEIVFPEKRIRMRAFDVAAMLGAGIAGLVTVVQTVLRNNSSKSVAVVILLALGLYVYRMWASFRRLRTDYDARMTRDLYHKNLDNALGVVQYLSDALEEQELKEALLAYGLLLESARPMTAKELDAAVERFVAERFPGTEVDFEVEDALAKLAGPSSGPPPATTEAAAAAGGSFSVPLARTLPPAEAGGAPRYEAVPVAEGLVALDAIWDGLFQFAAPAGSRPSLP